MTVVVRGDTWTVSLARVIGDPLDGLAGLACWQATVTSYPLEVPGG
jgi:hypothetical protein